MCIYVCICVLRSIDVMNFINIYIHCLMPNAYLHLPMPMPLVGPGPMPLLMCKAL